MAVMDIKIFDEDCKKRLTYTHTCDQHIGFVSLRDWNHDASQEPDMRTLLVDRVLGTSSKKHSGHQEERREADAIATEAGSVCKSYDLLTKTRYIICRLGSERFHPEHTDPSLLVSLRKSLDYRKAQYGMHAMLSLELSRQMPREFRCTCPEQKQG